MAGLLDLFSSNGLLGDPYNPARFAPYQPVPWINVPESQGFGPTEMSARQAPQPAPAPAPAPAAPRSPGFLGGISNGLADNSNTLLALGAGLMSGDGFGGGLKNAMVGAKLDQDRRVVNQTAQALTARGISPDLAGIVARNPTLLAGVMQNSLGIGAQTNDIKEYEYAKRQGFKGSLSDWMAQKRAGAGEYSLNPVYGTDQQGNTVLIQPGKSGTAIQTKLPDGVKISSGIEKLDLGTHWGVTDKRTGNIIGYVPKDLRGAATEKAIGAAQGTVQANLPADMIAAGQTTKQIDELLNNPGLDSIVGPLDQFRSSWMLGEKGRDALARYNQLKGKAFLDAYTTLRGGGAITEIEGQKAENAMARMERAQSEDDFRQSLKDFRDAVATGLQKLQARSGLSQQQPKTDLKSKYGLD